MSKIKNLSCSTNGQSEIIAALPPPCCSSLPIGSVKFAAQCGIGKIRQFFKLALKTHGFTCMVSFLFKFSFHEIFDIFILYGKLFGKKPKINLL
jgi:hypothetical protein